MTLIRAPRFLPYRLRAAWDLMRVRMALRGLTGTAPMPVARTGDSPVELQMLVCQRDVQLAVLATKSFLRFVKSPISVAFTSDGSVTPADRAWISTHIPGARWLERRDCRTVLDSQRYPRLARLYETNYHPLCKLLHPLLLSSAKRLMVLDPDAAFFKRPDDLLSWVDGSQRSSLFLHDHQQEDVQVPAETRQAFEELRKLLSADGRPWLMPYYFFNSGLLAYNREDGNLDAAESYLAWWEAAPELYTTGKPGLWFGNWTPEQTCYQVMFATMMPPATPLGEQYRIGSKPGYTFNHFLWLQLVEQGSLARLSQLSRELAAA